MLVPYAPSVVTGRRITQEEWATDGRWWEA